MRSTKRFRPALHAAVITTVAVIAPVVGTSSAQAGIVGGVSVESYCQDNYAKHSVLRYNNINGWRCTNGPTTTDSYVNFTSACATQRGTPYWGYHDYYNPYTIFCYT
ncbi:hypothetical protein [Micromonospora echinospora]|uniref:hypothetical protein n=1 Tax=Micromonospora echinospora TaxID=1877 RepID=UPI003A8AEF8F